MKTFVTYWDEICKSSLLRDAIFEAYEAGKAGKDLTTYWNSLCNNSTLKMAVREYFDANIKDYVSDHEEEWFNEGFEAGVELTREEIMTEIQGVWPDPPDLAAWRKRQADKKSPFAKK